MRESKWSFICQEGSSVFIAIYNELLYIDQNLPQIFKNIPIFSIANESLLENLQIVDLGCEINNPDIKTLAHITERTWQSWGNEIKFVKNCTTYFYLQRASIYS